MADEREGDQAAALEPSAEALALAQRFKEAIATCQWELGLHAFCALLGFNPDHEHGREKFRDFVSLASNLDSFDARRIATVLDWHASRQAHAETARDLNRIDTTRG